MRFSSQRAEEDLAAQAALEVSRNAERRKVEGLERPIGQEAAEAEVVAEAARRKKIKAVHILSICHSTIIQAFLKMLQVSRSHGHPAAL